MKILVRAITIVFFFVLLCSSIRAQTSSDSPNNQYSYERFSPSLAVIIVVLIAVLFFVGFFSIYIRHCSDSSATSGGIRRAISMRARRAAGARGLEASVIEGFPTFTYAEVKDHKIGKGVLECAVCLNEFQDEETLRLLPKCDHVFHPQCIDAWLESHVTCPVCRANLVPEDGGEEPNQQVSESTAVNEQDEVAVVIQIADNQQGNNSDTSSIDYKNLSVKRPMRMLSFGKFRSHSTGHDSLVQPGDNVDRFTLRLPAGVRKEVMERAALNRTKSFATTSLPRMGSSRRGYRSAAGRFYRRIDRAAQSDRWVFFTRALSMRSPRVVAETGEGSKRGGRTPVNMRSFNCLEPPSVDNGDEESLFSSKPERSMPV